ncbi:MAG: DUF465 domain-containing protein [Desulfovibrionaceae bacterium]|nr:DUF465 domain-containing protein [Desulfovibrionaceae bacterium]MBF0514722.1 DUF465 domain-containing protein [Desulfovibrionaceae bacterium]
MEQRELDLIERHLAGDAELKTLWEDHIRYEKLLERLETKPFRTPSEDLEVKDIKKKKLAGKTKLDALIQKYRKAEA